MITILSATNRRDSEALHFSKHCEAVLRSNTNEQVKLLALEHTPNDWFHIDMYDKALISPSLAALHDEFMLPASKFLFVTPEYNGSFPGALKLFLDACSAREYKQTFYGKKAALLGVASGRGGNLRGLEHLTGILNYLGTIVMPNRLAIASIEKLMDADGNITDSETRRVIEKQMTELLAF